MVQIASQSISVAGRIFMAAKLDCRATASVAAIPTAISAQATQRPRRASALRATVHYLPALTCRDFLSPASHHRSIVLIARPHVHTRRPPAEHQCEFLGRATFPPQPTEIADLRRHARGCADLKW